MPAVALVGGGAQRRARSLETPHIDDIAALLGFAAGLLHPPAQGRIRRRCATAGNLGSVEILIASRCVAELSDGLYAYQPSLDCLAVVEWPDDDPNGADPITRCCPDLAGAPSGAGDEGDFAFQRQHGVLLVCDPCGYNRSLKHGLLVSKSSFTN